MANWSITAFTMGVVTLAAINVRAAETNVPLVFSGGHEIGSGDFGRPVVLIAAALEVKPDQFREAFSGVTPSKNGPPSRDEAQKNKAALMKVLKPLGISNDRLDEVSNFYRYQPQRGELWKNTPAEGHAIVEDGKIKQIVITSPGAGYSTPPKVVVQGMEKTALKATIHLDKELKKNGGIEAVEVAATETKSEK